MSDAHEIAANLTKAQREVIAELGQDWSLAPFCGCHRRQGAVAANLHRIGLVDRVSPGIRFADAPAYRLTPLGLSVRALLLEDPRP